MRRRYYRYRLTYPHKGSVIYKSPSMTKAVKNCYKEFRERNDIGRGMFVVTNLDKKKEYQFRAHNDKVYKLKGGMNEDNIDIMMEHIVTLPPLPKKS